MTHINQAITNTCAVIDENIAMANSLGRGLLSQNILAQLRNLVEHVAMKAMLGEGDAPDDYDTIKKALSFIKGKAKYNYLAQLHRSLQPIASHYTLDPDSSERLMLHYFDALLQIRERLKTDYSIDVLANLDAFPLYMDADLQTYYDAAASVVDELMPGRTVSWEVGRFRVIRIRPFVAKQRIYYEMSLSPVSGGAGKGERIIAFAAQRIDTRYAIRVSLKRQNVFVRDAVAAIDVITDYRVSIRPCELERLSEIVGVSVKTRSSDVDYRRLMECLTDTHLSLLDIVELEQEEFNGIMGRISAEVKPSRYVSVLMACRNVICANSPGCNVLRYLLYTMENEILKVQVSDTQNEKLSGLKLAYGCIPFDRMPFASSLIGHNPRLPTLLKCIDGDGRDCEFFARRIRNEAECEGRLYVPKTDLSAFGTSPEVLAEQFNNVLYYKHVKRRIEYDKGNFFIKGYEEDVRNILASLARLAGCGIPGYSASAINWLAKSPTEIDDPQKRDIIPRLFERSRVAAVYGAAGTGKSTLVKHVADYLADKRKLFLANTNSAVDNLRRKVGAANSEFSTIAKCRLRDSSESHYTLLAIDECSTVSNTDMVTILSKVSFDLLLLVGDVHQIESISFGNWFGLLEDVLPEYAHFELENPYRSTDESLRELWNKVRTGDEGIIEFLEKQGYSAALPDALLASNQSDEIVLCLNYDGLYGINNMNKRLQALNANKPLYFGSHVYKVGDPVLFTDSRRFSPVLYNNLKGRISGIANMPGGIVFDLELDKAVSGLDVMNAEVEYIGTDDEGHSTVRIVIDRLDPSKEDSDDGIDRSIVPFQVAYAVSIHKAQGLEYDSVRVVISNEVGEKITHNIFYTAITRARKRLTIYWSPETEKAVLADLKQKEDKASLYLLRARYGKDLSGAIDE